MKRYILKGILPVFLALLVVVTSSVTAFAVTTEETHGGTYGYIIPTDENLAAQKNSYTFYGNSTTLYFMLFPSGKENSYYTIEICSTNDYNPDNIVSSFTQAYQGKESVPLALSWPFKSNPSGTYYGRCYTSIINGEDEVIDKSTICEFTIKINRIGKETVSLTSISNLPNGIKIKWTGLSTAVKYRIYRKEKGVNKNFVKLADVKAGTTSYTDKNVKNGVQYYYTVKAYDNLYSSLCEKPGLTTIRLSEPTISAPDSKGSVYPVIKWSKIEGCQGYYIYRKGGSLNDSTGYKKIATIKNPTTLTYTDKTATSPDWAYTYTVRAYYGKFYSSRNDTGVSYNCLSEPTVKSVESTTGGITVSWLDSNNFTEKYSVYRKAEGDKKWKRIAGTNENPYTDTKVTHGVKYSYSIKAVSATNSSTYNKTGLTTMYIEAPKPEKVEIYSSGNTKIFWNAVPKADGYIVYRSINGEAYKRIAKIKNPKTLTYKDKSTKKSGDTYSYQIRAYIGSYKSGYSTPVLTTMFLTAPTVTAKNEFTVEQGSSVKITWNSVDGAKAYKVLRKGADDTKWTVLASNVTDKFYLDKTAESGSKYYYAVRALNDKFSSSYISTELVTVLATPILTDSVNTNEGVTVTWSPVTGAESYSIFRRTLSGAWENIGSSTTTQFVDSSENAITTPYLYTVRAVLGDLKSNYMINGVGNFVNIESIDLLFEENKEENTAFITVTWKSNGADKYEIYRSDNGATAVLLTTINDGSTQSYVDKVIVQGSTYTYTVKPIKENKISVTATSEKLKWEFPPIPVIQAHATPYYANADVGDRIEVIWEGVEHAETYDVYRKTADTDWVYLATIPSDSNYTYVDTSIETDVTYYYSVKGVSADRDSLFDDKGVSAMLIGPIEPIEDIFVQLANDPSGNGKKVVTLAWEANEKATFYHVMRKTGTDGEWQFMKLFLNTDLLVYTDYSIEQGVTYTYTVHAFGQGIPSVDNMVGKTIIWPSDTPPAEDTTKGEETTTPDTTVPGTNKPETTVPETTTPETTVPVTTQPTTKPEETTDKGLDIPDA